MARPLKEGKSHIHTYVQVNCMRTPAASHTSVCRSVAHAPAAADVVHDEMRRAARPHISEAQGHNGPASAVSHMHATTPTHR